MSQTEEEFKTVYTLLEKKYLEGPYPETVQIQGFFSYFRLQWGPDSPVSKWYEGSYPFHNCTNMGLEQRNCDLKDDFSYRDQLNMGQFVGMMEDASEHYSKRDNCVLDGNRLLILSKDEDDKEERETFKIEETGYKYFAENLKPLPPTAPETINPVLETTVLNTHVPELETTIPYLSTTVTSPLALPTSPVFPTSYLQTIASTPITVASPPPISLPAPTLTKKCRAKFGVEDMDKWCKPCTRKKKCIGE